MQKIGNRLKTRRVVTARIGQKMIGETGLQTELQHWIIYPFADMALEYKR